jgi:hypothetical protein
MAQHWLTPQHGELLGHVLPGAQALTGSDYDSRDSHGSGEGRLARVHRACAYPLADPGAIHYALPNF